MPVVLNVAAAEERPELCVRPWLAVDMPGLLAAMAREGPEGGPRSHPNVGGPGPRNWSKPLGALPRNEGEAVRWLSGQEDGWANGDWLTFAVLDAARNRVVGHVGLMNRDGGQANPARSASGRRWMPVAAASHLRRCGW